MRVRRSKARTGLTLVEVLAAMTVTTIVLGLCVALITMLLKLSDSSHRHATDEAARMRVARLFREDARAASTFVSKEGGKRIWFRQENGDSVEYSGSRDGLMRVAWWGDEVVKTERLPLPLKSSPRFETAPNVVALLLDRRQPMATDEAKARVLRIEAAPGASRRFIPRGSDSR